MKSRFRILIPASLMLVFLVMISMNAICCTNINYGKDANTLGAVINTGEQQGWCDPNIVIVPGAKHEPGTMAPVYLYRFANTSIPPREIVLAGEIPQVEETYTYFHSGFPFMNEHSVFISDELIFQKPELANPNGIMDTDQLMVFALQRAKTAREAIQVAGALAEEYGYAATYGAEAWSVTDPNEAWWFEIYGGGADWYYDCGRPGAVWVAQRVPDDEVSFNVNRGRIDEIDLDNKEFFMASSNIYSLAEDLGYWDPDSGEPFRVWEAYTVSRGVNPRENRFIQLMAPSMIKDKEEFLTRERWPFSVKPDKGKLTLEEIMEIQKDFWEGIEYEEYDLTKSLGGGPWGMPERYQRGLFFSTPFSSQSCTYNLVTIARNWMPPHIGGLMWFGYDKTATSIQMPLYCGVTQVPDSWLNQTRVDVDRNSMYWASNFISNWANLKFSYMIKDIREKRAELMGEMFALQPYVEATALEIYKDNPDLARQYLTNYVVQTGDKTVKEWWKFADHLVTKYMDGGILGEPTPAYPEWWVEAVKAWDAENLGK